MSSPNPINTQSNFLPPEIDFPQDNNEFREILSNRQRLLANVVNVKENANYERRELITAQQWFSQVVSGYIKTQYGFRVTYDLVSLNGGPIPNGLTTVINIPTDPAVNTPTVISYTTGLQPTHGFGAGVEGTTYYFINDPLLYVRFVNTSAVIQTVNITNNTGGNVDPCVWCFEYLKT